MTVLDVDDMIVMEPFAFREVVDRLTETPLEDRRHPQTGPRTDDGKDRSKRNSTRHGLTGKGDVLTPEIQDEADAMIARLNVKYQPQDETDHQLIRDAAVGYARQYEAIHQQTLLLTSRSQEALYNWGSKIECDVEEIAARLKKNPGLTVAQLRRTDNGARWLIEQWKHLYKSLTREGDWTPREQELAQDLAGLLPSLRDRDPLNAQRGTLEQRKTLVRKKVRELRGLIGGGRELLGQLDRAMVIEGFIPAAGTEYRRLKRYEREARNFSDRAILALEARRLARQEDQEKAKDGNAAGTIADPTPRFPRPPKPIITSIDVAKAANQPNPPPKLMQWLEKSYSLDSDRILEPNDLLPATVTPRAAAPKPVATPTDAPEKTTTWTGHPAHETPAPTIVPTQANRKAPRDHELDADALHRREQRRQKRKARKNRR